MKTQIPWLQHVDAWRSSGLTQAQYCRQHGLAAKSFSFWLRRRRTEESAVSVVDLIPVQIAQTDKASNSVSTWGSKPKPRKFWESINFNGLAFQFNFSEIY
jgi:hypothetical protein